MATIRTIQYERDTATDAQTVLDIREFDAPAGQTPATWTALARDGDVARRTLLLDIARQLDELATGTIDEIRIFAL